MRVLILLCSGALLAAQALYAADPIEQAASACATPRVPQKSWHSVTVSCCGIRFRLPSRYVEKRGQVTVGDYVGARYTAGLFDTLDIEVLRGENAAFTKVTRQSDYQGYSECVVEIGGHKATVQSFRGGVIFDGVRSYPAFDIEATWQLRPGYTLHISGGASTRQSQEEILAIVRSVQFVE